jgi:putative flippase GtrA
LTSSRRWSTFVCYAAGSLIATVCSEVVLVAGYALLGLGPQVASVVAWVAGALPNYLLNRRWAWRERGPSPLVRETLPYWLITLATAALAIGVTTAADGWVSHAVTGRADRSFALGVIYQSTYVLAFAIKFLIFDGWVFSGKRSAASAESGVVEAVRS